MSVPDRKLDLRFFDPERPDDRSVPASALAQSLEALQRLVHLIAMRRDGRTPKQRIRPSADIQNRYRLICQVPQDGSYVSPVRIEGSELLTPADTEAVFDDLEKILSAAGAQDESAFIETVPDEVWLRFYVDALGRLPPPLMSGVELEIAKRGRTLLSTSRSRNFLERLFRAPVGRVVRGTIVGAFKKIDFARQEITVRHVQTERDLTCVYEDYVEENLLEHPRDLLLIFGTVTRDGEGRPVSIEDVDHIEPVDLGSIDVGPVRIDGRLVVPIEPLTASVSFDEAETLYLAEIERLGVLVYGETRDMLSAAIEDEIVVLWSRYACSPDEKLTRAAQTLKARVRDAFHESSDAA
jgi:hypothetical protein